MVHFHPLAPLITPAIGLMVLSELLRASNFSERIKRWDLGARAPNWFWWLVGVALFGTWGFRLAAGQLPDEIAPWDGLIGRALRAVAGLF